MDSLKSSGQKCDNATTCGFKWTATGVAYRCRTCQLFPSMALCPDCFKGGNHEGHDFNTVRISAGGFCDCGDKSFMKETGFCQRHGSQNQIYKPGVADVHQLRDNIESVQKYDEPTTCGLTWAANYKAYRCRTCALSPSMSLCSDCFLNGNHEGHDFNEFRSPVGGFCDCGDKSFMRETGFCSRHGPQNEINKPEDSSATDVQKLRDNTESALERLSRDFKTVMLNGDHTDVTVKVKGEEFRLHKVILSARNPYFDAMFKTDMKETSTGIVTIEDCEPHVFRSFMHFLYTGKVDEFSINNVCGLYETADKYQENDFKKECLYFMLNALSVDSFFDLIVLALRYGEMELLQRATELFKTKGKEIARNVKWQGFMKEYPVQANELFIKTLDHYIK